MIRVSVALCTFNGARYLPSQLRSISLQSQPPDEVVVADDNSRDESIKLVESFSKTADFEVRIHRNNTTVGSTKNFERAIRLCRGELIFLADQDDVWHTKKIQKVGKVFSESPEVGATFTDAELVAEDLTPLHLRLWRAKRFGRCAQREIVSGQPLKVLLKHNVVTGATMAFRSRFKELVLPIPEVWIHDAWIALLIACVARLLPISEPLIEYRQQPDQLIGARIPSFAEQLADTRSPRRRDFEIVAHRYELAYERLSQLAPSQVRNQGTLAAFEEKVEHAKSRETMPREILRRAPTILRELASLRYHRYSMGSISAIRDLLFSNGDDGSGF